MTSDSHGWPQGVRYLDTKKCPKSPCFGIKKDVPTCLVHWSKRYRSENFGKSKKQKIGLAGETSTSRSAINPWVQYAWVGLVFIGRLVCEISTLGSAKNPWVHYAWVGLVSWPIGKGRSLPVQTSLGLLPKLLAEPRVPNVAAEKRLFRLTVTS